MSQSVSHCVPPEMKMLERTLGDLTPNEFENLTYDLLCMLGLKNAVWRTPGADGGRDIEGIVATTDFSGQVSQQKWYVECKRYSSSIDWPTIYEKIAYADVQQADYMLLSTNNNPSPACESKISEWNLQRYRVVVRVWRGYDITRILEQFPHVRSKFNIGEQDAQQAAIRLQPLMFEVMKTVQSAYSLLAFGHDALPEVETCAALSELVTRKAHQLSEVGRIHADAPFDTPPTFSWLEWRDGGLKWPEAGLRAILCFYRHVTKAEKIVVTQCNSEVIIQAEQPKYNLSISAISFIRELCFWSFFELQERPENSISIRGCRVNGHG